MSYEYVNGMYVNTDSFRDHSITFGDRVSIGDNNWEFRGVNTWKDWHLIPASRPVVAQAGVSTNFVDIPGRADGPIDMSDYLTGKIIYGARSGSFEFLVDNDHENWESIRTKIVDYLHGKRMKMCLSDDSAYYYEGRFTLNEWRSESWNSTVSINYAVAPYKYYVNAGGDWLWDPFNFETDDTDTVNSSEGRL